MLGRRTRDIILAVSLATNVFVLGAAVGLRASGARMVGVFESAGTELAEGGGRLDFTPRAYLAALPAAERRKLRAETLRASREAIPLVRDLRDRQRAALGLASGETVDPEALDAALADLRAAQTALVERGHHVLIDLISATDPMIRAEVIERAKRRERGPRAARWRAVMAKDAGTSEN